MVITGTVIELNDLTVRFRRRGREMLTALEGLTLQIEPGQVFGLLGPNGSGKTTTVNVLCGLVRPTSGTALVEGIDVRRGVSVVRSRLGVVPQETALYNDLTAQENLDFHAAMYGVSPGVRRTLIDEMLDLVGLTSRRHDRVGTYSGGMQRRLALARALLTQPSIVVLDEPTLGVDVQSRAALWERIRAIATSGRTVLLTTNYMEEAQTLADTVAILDRGKLIASGTPMELQQRAGESSLTLEADLTRDQVEGLWAIPGVSRVLWEKPLAMLYSSDGAGVLPSVLAYLHSGGVAPRQLSMRQPDLNDVFLALTGRALRD